jgi:hypothetical protein
LFFFFLFSFGFRLINVINGCFITPRIEEGAETPTFSFSSSSYFERPAPLSIADMILFKQLLPTKRGLGGALNHFRGKMCFFYHVN